MPWAVAQYVLLDSGAVVGFPEGFVFTGQTGGLRATAGDQHGQGEAGQQVSRGASWSNFLLLF
jgi:hypothetical protein